MVLDDTDLMESVVFMFCFFSIYIQVLLVRSEEKSLKKIDIFFFLVKIIMLFDLRSVKIVSGCRTY